MDVLWDGRGPLRGRSCQFTAIDDDPSRARPHRVQAAGTAGGVHGCGLDGRDRFRYLEVGSGLSHMSDLGLPLVWLMSIRELSGTDRAVGR
jgi:hypothetical protein